MDQYEGKYNTKSTSVKRLMREAQELKEATEDYFARPLEENLFEWHFTIRGPPDSDFSGGLYHGRILLPAEYPMKPPNIILLTPNGRFEVNKKICLSISGHHPETWQPSWSIRTALLALIAFMPTPGVGTIGSLDFTPEERRQLAIKSHSFVCPDCGKTIFELTTGVSKPVTEEEKSLINCVAFKGEEVPSSSSGSTDPSVKKSQVEGTSQSDLRFRTPSSPDATTGHVRENVALDNHTAEANNIHGSQNFPSNFIDRNRNLIIVLIVLTIGLLILRRLVES